jgi:hypothetical protein
MLASLLLLYTILFLSSVACTRPAVPVMGEGSDRCDNCRVQSDCTIVAQYGLLYCSVLSTIIYSTVPVVQQLADSDRGWAAAGQGGAQPQPFAAQSGQGTKKKKKKRISVDEH